MIRCVAKYSFLVFCLQLNHCATLKSDGNKGDEKADTQAAQKAAQKARAKALAKRAITKPLASQKKVEAENADIARARITEPSQSSDVNPSKDEMATATSLDELLDSEAQAMDPSTDEPAGFMEEDLAGPGIGSVESPSGGANGLDQANHSNSSDQATVIDGNKKENSAVATGVPQKPNDDMSEIYRTAIEHQNHPYVAKWVDYFTKSARDRFQRYLNRGYIYRPLIEEVLAKQGVPKEMFYLALIESGFHNNATSRARAVGIWQFIVATARRYGLEVNRSLDERKDPVRATVAAAAYLNDLHRVYQDWNLAMAGYNAGEVRILRAVMNTSARDFWSLLDKNQLPRETRNYVPKFLAAIIVGENYRHFGFSEPTDQRYPSLKVAEVKSQSSLRELSKLYSVSESMLRLINPHLKHGVIPYVRGGYRVWLPATDGSMSDQSLKEIQENVSGEMLANRSTSRVETAARNRNNNSETYETRGEVTRHKVRRGENLALIARKYGTSINRLKQLNNLTTSKLAVGKVLKVADERSSTAQRELAMNEGDLGFGINDNKLYQEKRSNFYQVRSGDSLFTIAKKFGTTITYLKKLNNLQKAKLYVGQMLLVMR